MHTEQCLLPANVLLGILANLYSLCLESQNDREKDSGNPHTHYCSLQFPCTSALRAFQPIYRFKLVCQQYKHAVLMFQEHEGHRFIQPVESVYYPNPRHINTKIRSSTVFQRYRVFKTIDTECGDRGVFEAYDYGHSGGCEAGTKVIVKAWLDPADGECFMESRIYKNLALHSVNGLPIVHANQYYEKCGVYALVLQKLGPSLDDLLNLIPSRKFDRRMVLALAIQMIGRYETLHSVGVIHNGVKPGNICLSASPKDSSQLNLIDFGLSYLCIEEVSPLPSELRHNPVGNRQFLSVHGHLGITQSQRDDLESLGYLFSFVYHGHLPWDATRKPQHTAPRSRDHTTPPEPHIWQIKIATPASVLFRDMDPAFLRFWKDVKSMAFGERPAYARLRSYFVQAWKADLVLNPGIDKSTPGEIDWLEIYSRLQMQEDHRLREEEVKFQQLLLNIENIA